jgi:hypothetical protein
MRTIRARITCFCMRASHRLHPICSLSMQGCVWVVRSQLFLGPTCSTTLSITKANCSWAHLFHNIEHLQTRCVLEQVRKIVLFGLFDALIPFFLCN